MFQLNSSLIDQSNGIKVLSCRYQQSLETVGTFATERCSQIGPSRHLSNRVFHSQEYLKYLNYKAHLFFKILKNLCRFQKCNKICRKNLYFFRKLHLNWLGKILSIMTRIHVISSQCGNHHS